MDDFLLLIDGLMKIALVVGVMVLVAVLVVAVFWRKRYLAKGRQ